MGMIYGQHESTQKYRKEQLFHVGGLRKSSFGGVEEIVEERAISIDWGETSIIETMGREHGCGHALDPVVPMKGRQRQPFKLTFITAVCLASDLYLLSPMLVDKLCKSMRLISGPWPNPSWFQVYLQLPCSY